MKILKMFFSVLFFITISNAQTVHVHPSDMGQIESPIAINPTNPDNFIGTAITQDTENHIGYYYTLNGGIDWQGKNDISGPGVGDPVIAFDPDGTAYLLYQNRSDGQLYLHISYDGGINWTSRYEVLSNANPEQFNIDRPWMAVSPVRNSDNFFDIYVCYTQFEGPDIPEDETNGDAASQNTTAFENKYIVLIRSINGGANFSDSKVFTPENSEYRPQGSVVAVGKDGNIALAWANLNLNGHTKEICLVHSQNYNTISGQARVHFETQQIGIKSGSNFYIKGGKVRVDSWPRISSNSITGDFYVVWSGKGSTSLSDIHLVKSRKIADGSAVWQQLNNVDQSDGHQFNPAVSVSPDGVVNVLYCYTEDNEYYTPIFSYLKYSVNDGLSFSGRNTIGETEGFIIEETEYTFLGDYQGLTSWFDKAYAFFCQNMDTGPENNKRQVYFQSINIPQKDLPDGFAKVQVDQKDISGESFGTFERWNQGLFAKYTAPHDFVFIEETNEYIKAKQDFKDDSNEKYQEWQINSIFDNIVNYNSFEISQNQLPIQAWFHNAHNTILHTGLLSGSSNGGYVEFIDPWLIDYYDEEYDSYRNRGMEEAIPCTLNTPYTISLESDYMGVFLDQGFPDWLPPYYSVNAPQVQSLTVHDNLGIRSFFRNWSASGADLQHTEQNETPVVFRQPNATVTALYKGHLASGSERASGRNNARALAKTDDGALHLVYEDNNEIYYTSSADNGTEWTDEIEISTGNDNINPSISSWGILFL